MEIHWQWGYPVRPLKAYLGTYIQIMAQEREYDFVEKPLGEYFCPVSLDVLLEPYQTQCCANHLSQEAYQRLQGQPCPVCREENLVAA